MINLEYLYSKILKKSRGRALSNSILDLRSKVGAGSSLANSSIDRYSYCGYDCIIANCNIGAFCSIASRVTIGGARHPMEYLSTSSVFLSHRDSIRKKLAKHVYLPVEMVTIGNDVWIGDGAFIKAGIVVGHGAVIGMGAVVTKDVAPYAIVGGNPARVLKMRFNEEIVHALLAMQWWNYSDDQLSKLGPDFLNPEALLKSRGYL